MIMQAIEEKLLATNAKLRAAGHRAIKNPIASILSLCLVAGIATTTASFSQTSEPTVAVAPAQTMPVAHTLTSADGRTIDVTILSKSDTAIKAKKADGKEAEITLDKLSEADKAFVAGLIEKKARVLLMGTVFSANGNFQMITDLLKKHGFDVTIGVYRGLGDKDGEAETEFDKISKVEKAVLVNTTAAIDPYDILWIQNFSTDLTPKPNLFDVVRHHHAAGKLAVINSFFKTPHPDLFMVEGAIGIHTGDTSNKARMRFKKEELINYFITPYEKQWVFYDWLLLRNTSIEKDFYKTLAETVKKAHLDQ